MSARDKSQVANTSVSSGLVIASVVALARLGMVAEIHEAFDLSRQERRMFNIEDDNLAVAAFNLRQDEDFGQLLKTLSQRLSDPIRECYWYARILDCCVTYNSRSTLFICGADHITAMYNLIESTGMEVLIAQHDYPP